MQPTMEEMVGTFDLDVINRWVEHMRITPYRLRFDQLIFRALHHEPRAVRFLNVVETPTPDRRRYRHHELRRQQRVCSQNHPGAE
jgi:hypothetical protein